MKKRNRRKPKIADKKLRGEWAEMHFMVRATDHDLPVSKPWGDSRSYDLVVGWPGHFLAVQVKSTTLEVEAGGYACGVCSGGKPYPPGSFDFLAAYVIYEDAWYIIPAEEILGQAWVTVYPQSAKSKYAKYREAWHLLHRDADAEPGYIDDIQGCAEEFSPEWVEEGAENHSLTDDWLGG
jgi:PD-(D/E)XK endonuclease